MAAVSTAAPRPARLRRRRPWLRLLIGAGLVGAVISVAGTQPFLRGIAAVSPPAVAAAVTLAAVATVAAAWRWRVVAAGFGLQLGWRESVAAYYRSQFLNAVLPGGIVGDVHRALSHGRDVDQIAQAARAVAAERAAGQVVQLVLALGVLAVAGTTAYAPAMALLPIVAVAAIALAVVVAASRRARAALGRELAIVRAAFAAPSAILRVAAASVIGVTAHVATFLVACGAVGVSASTERVTAAAVIAVAASSIPASVGGWGPREAAAAWAFGAAGVGAAAGIAAATAYGVLAVIALAPGAVVAAASFLHRRRPTAAREGVSRI